MYLEKNNNTKWLLLALLGFILGGGAIVALLLNRSQTYKTPAASRPGLRSVICRWETSQIPPGYRVVISLVSHDGKILRAIPNPAGNSYTFDDIDPVVFPTSCRLEILPNQAGLEACVREVPVTCQNIPTPTSIGPTNTPVPSNTPTPGGPSNTPIPSGNPSPTPKNPTSTPSLPTSTPSVPTSTPAPTNTPVPLTPPIGGPGPTNTPVPLSPTSTPRPGGPTSTPAPTNTPVPAGPTKTPELPKAGINAPTVLIVAMGVVILLLAFAL